MSGPNLPHTEPPTISIRRNDERLSAISHEEPPQPPSVVAFFWKPATPFMHLFARDVRDDGRSPLSLSRHPLARFIRAIRRRSARLSRSGCRERETTRRRAARRVHLALLSVSLALCVAVYPRSSARWADWERVKVFIKNTACVRRATPGRYVLRLRSGGAFSTTTRFQRAFASSTRSRDGARGESWIKDRGRACLSAPAISARRCALINADKIAAIH